MVGGGTGHFRLISPDEPFPAELRMGVVAIGNFDGVHLGHRRLLAVAQDQARGLQAPWGLVTFEPHPKTFFRPLEPVFRLTPLPLKARLVAELGADFVAVIRFDSNLASREPQEFVERGAFQRLGVRHVVTGYDFHFGKGRRGTPETMRTLGRRLGFGVTVIDQVTDDDGLAPYSSSAIRSALRRGHLPEANHQLGYEWIIMGRVVPGDRRGRSIGFPTANIAVEEGEEPFAGIYAVRVNDPATGERWQGAGYFGDRPTFETNRTFLEVYLFDFDGDLYGRELMVSFAALIRPDRKFASAEALVAQMREDCVTARRLLTISSRT